MITSFLGKRKLRDVVASMLQAESLAYMSAEDFANQIAFYLTPLGQRPSLEVCDPSMLQDLRIAASTLCLVPEEIWTRDSPPLQPFQPAKSSFG